MTKLYKGKGALFKLLKVNDENFLYDTGTNKILECEPEVFDLIEEFNRCQSRWTGRVP